MSEDGDTNVTLRLPNADNYDSLKWQKQDQYGTWRFIFPNTASDSPEYIPDTFGAYRLEVVVDCLSPESIVYSPTINVSICPRDFDEDGVVDNIDLDIDNDGIYNSIESLGDFNVDLTATPPGWFSLVHCNMIHLNCLKISLSVMEVSPLFLMVDLHPFYPQNNPVMMRFVLNLPL